jgi:hypothetical protein
MKRFIYNTAVALGVLLGASSCDGFLDRIPTDSVVSESAMATLADAEVVANGLYTDLKYYTMYGSYIPYMGDMRGDNLYPTNASGTGRTIYTLEYEPVQSTYFGMWQNYYTTIMRANTLIANIETIPVMSSADQVKKDDILGQALAIRALCHWDVARLYGYPYMKDNGASLGAVVLTEVVAPSESKLPRNTVAETYAQVEKDLTLALTKLSKSKNDGHFNYWAARMLQAKVALYKGDWQTAFTAASEVVESSPYRMVPNSEYLAYWGKQCDDESVLEFLVTNTGDIDSDGGFYTMYHNMWFDDKGAGADIIPSKAWKDLFAETPNDVRAQMLAYDDPETGVVKTGETWLKKFIGNKDLGYTFRRNNPRIFRITDAYLMAAEAALELAGKQDVANEYLNAVVKRADPTAADVVATLDRIQIERQKEFIGEGHRFFDVLRRGGKIVKDASLDDRDFAGNTRQEIDWNDHRVVLPISHNEIMLYPELQQNPGY